MNNKKIAFIACVNDSCYWEECLLYLSRLIIPGGYETEVLAVEGAASMAAGYNEGMRASDAKYKIYLHQDTFITDQYFLVEAVEIFQSNPGIGMIGGIGCVVLPRDYVMWHGERVSSIYNRFRTNAEKCRQYTQPSRERLMYVEAIDGLLMATQYDIPWPEEVLDGWDFYDVAQSVLFRKAGYKIAVPVLDKPICVHDDGLLLNLENYEKYRLKCVEFCQTLDRNI